MLHAVKPRPLEGLQVLQLGARVTKVEPPAGGDYLQALAHGRRDWRTEAAETLMRAHDVPVSRARSLRQCLNHAEAVGLLETQETGISETVRAPGLGWRSFEPGPEAPA